MSRRSTPGSRAPRSTSGSIELFWSGKLGIDTRRFGPDPVSEEEIAHGSPACPRFGEGSARRVDDRGVRSEAGGQRGESSLPGSSEALSLGRGPARHAWYFLYESRQQVSWRRQRLSGEGGAAVHGRGGRVP